MEYPFVIPASVPHAREIEYIDAQQEITHGTGKLMLFAGDQKVEHLNKDFFGEGIDESNANPEHLFKIASGAKIGAFATQLGLIDRYGRAYRSIPYIVKLNSKSNIIPNSAQDPISSAWYSVDDVVRFRQQSGLQIYGVGYTLFLGSAHEAVMLREAAQAMFMAHLNGMVGMVWVYPRGKYVEDEHDDALIAGAAGVAACLGADYAKINPPKTISGLKNAVQAAGTTKIICAGGEKIPENIFLQTLWKQIHEGGTSGSATGRNIHQKSLVDAIDFCEKIYAITVEDKKPE